jgi:hypothetical protein
MNEPDTIINGPIAIANWPALDLLFPMCSMLGSMQLKHLLSSYGPIIREAGITDTMSLDLSSIYYWTDDMPLSMFGY